MWRTIGIVMGCGFLLIPWIELRAANEEKQEPGRSEISSHILDITDLVLEKHIDPPTRQQMILSAIKNLYSIENQPAPRDLSRRISELSDRKQMADYLEGVCGGISRTAGCRSHIDGGSLRESPRRRNAD